MGLDDLDRRADKGGQAAVRTVGGKALATVIWACSPEPDLALLHSVLLVSVDVLGHCWSKSDQRSCACADAAKDWLVILTHGHGHSPSAQR